MYSRYVAVLSVLLALVGFVVAASVPVSTQAQDITVTVPEVDPSVDETVTLSIQADLGGNQVDAYTGMEFTFDSSVLNIVEVRDGDELSFGSGNLTVNEDGDTLRIINIADNPPVEGSGEFLEIDVELTQDAGIPFKLTPSATGDIGEPSTSVFESPNEGILEIDEIDQGRVGLVSIQEARQQGPNSSVAVQGTVTRSFGDYVRLQDESGPTGASALVLRQTAENSLATDFRDDITNGNITQGTRLLVTGTLSESDGLLRINNEDLTEYTIEDQESLPPAQVVSLSDLEGPDGEDYESELIRVENVSFQDPSATGGTLASETSYTVEDGEGTSFTYRVEGSEETDVIGASIPSGTFVYEGVVGQSNNSSGNDEGYRLIPVHTSSGLPVEMTGFNAVPSGTSVELTWQTASETTNAGFHVQRQSVDGTWTDLGFVKSKAEGGTTSRAHSYRYVVENDLEPGTHRFRLKQVDLDGTPHPSQVETVDVQMKEALILNPPAPNPTSGQVTFTFAVKKKASEAQVVVYNVLGQRVKTLFDGTPRPEQSKTLSFDTSDLPSGVYVMQLQTEGQTRTQRLTVVR